MRFQDKVVFVTGSGAGIGRAAALAFAREGAKVVTNSRTGETGQKTLEMIEAAGGTGMFLQGDVSKAAEVKRMVEQTAHTFGPIDILVNCAGVVLGGRADNTTEEEWDTMMDTNAKGAFLMIRETLPAMLKRQKGVIINVSSVAANKGLKNRMGYSASKGAMLSMGRSIAVEYADKGIRCNTICPGTIFTPSLQHRSDNAPDPG